MPVDILSRLCPPNVLVGDGAIGTYLQAQGLPPGTPPELWNIEQPEMVRSMHVAYLVAGAQLLTSNTFSGNRLRMPDKVNGHSRAELVRRGVEIARQVAGDLAWVAGSMGPSGRLIEPLGDVKCEEAEDAFAEQAALMAEAGVDVILVETMSDPLEARAALRGAQQVTNLPVFVTFSFDETGRTMMGTTAEAAAREAQTLGAAATGANCGHGAHAVMVALEQMRRAVTIPLIAQPNAGMPRLQATGETTWDGTPDEFAESARTLINLGARMVGACCGSTPAHILAIRAAVDAVGA